MDKWAFQERGSERALRLLLALSVAVFGYFSVTHSLAQNLMLDDPARAHAIAPYDGRLTAQLAISLTDADVSRQRASSGSPTARLALRQEPAAVTAVSALVLGAAGNGDMPRARQLLANAWKLSRRDIHAQLFGIQSAVAQGDVRDALHGYDLALRTNPSLQDTLIPLLASATQVAPVRVGLVETLVRHPPWSDGFLLYTSSHSQNPEALADLLLALHRRRINVPQDSDAAAIGGLVDAGLTDIAWSFYRSIRGDIGDHRRSRDPGFKAQFEAPTRFDWAPVADQSITSSLNGGVFAFSVPASVGGPLLRQLQLLPAGDYDFKARGSALDQVNRARLYWTLDCADGRSIGHIDAQPNGNFAGVFHVPSDCRPQTLALVARASDAATLLAGQVETARLTPHLLEAGHDR